MTERIDWEKMVEEYDKELRERIPKMVEEAREELRKLQAARRHAAATGSSLYPKWEDES